MQGEDPEAADRDPGEVGCWAVEERFGERSRRREGRSSAAAVDSQKSAAKEVATTFAGSVRLVVEAQQRLDRAESDDDAGRDDRCEHHLRGAVVGGRQVARVER